MQETVISLTSLFLGDSTEIHEDLSKSGTKSVSGLPQEDVNSSVNTSIDINVLVHSLVDRIDTLESNLKKDCCSTKI